MKVEIYTQIYCIGVTLFTWSTHVNCSAGVEPVDPCVDHGWMPVTDFIGIASVSPSRNFRRFRDATTDSELRVRGHYTEFCDQVEKILNLEKGYNPAAGLLSISRSTIGATFSSRMRAVHTEHM